MVYRVTCSSEFFLMETTFIVGINLLVSVSTALHAFSLVASSVVWFEPPLLHAAFHITLEIPVQLQTFLNKNCSINFVFCHFLLWRLFTS